MVRLRFVLTALIFLLPSLHAQAQELCSTEKVNHKDCTVYISRRYPVTLPTIQMHPGKKVTVVVLQPLGFESLSLDWTTGTALPGTDQGATLLTAVVPDLKGLYFSNVTVPLPPGGTATTGAEYKVQVNPNVIPPIVDPCDKTNKDKKGKSTYNAGKCVEKLENDAAQAKKDEEAKAAAATKAIEDAQNTLKDDLEKLHGLLDTVRENFRSDDLSLHLVNHVAAVYAQLNQVLSPIPKPGFEKEADYIAPSPLNSDPAELPRIDPWTDYVTWREMMLCELAGVRNDSTRCDERLPFSNLLGDISTLQGKLPAATPTQGITISVSGKTVTPPPPDPDPNQLFDQKYFDYTAKQANSALKNVYPGLTPEQLKGTDESKQLQMMLTEEALLTSQMSVISNTLTNVQKDFVTYYQNILLVPNLPKGVIGTISDPAVFQKGNTPVSTHRLLGRQVTYSVNAVNQISTPLSSITATTAKISIATVTVLYADPIFETSAGGLVSFVHNRTFANQTVITPQPGTLQVAGDVIISQIKTDPELEPFVAGHWRLTPEFTMPDQRRGAIYTTAWVGLNAYTSLPEYGAGPTLSWRSFMISALYNRAHVVALSGSQTLGEIVCSPNAATGATPPSCTPAPAAPITQTNAINAFAIGISIRLPTTFTAGTGGVSH
jgi:hypothetical protein